ncbi:tetratricopeptide repeat protein [Oceanibacterium hippocampi]|uniref:Tetratricopeptide repeat protein n=1 Tax=Oceanibacterium hippocampi TaxID=745714 RepID=A0A1Y5RRE6_9PROT|nr:hypothetical protein [Oceanibacterium hippocampi]SLN23492.1 Tetratricopeptide repeat protein [Oceanibacterium hippocampi]
MPRKHRPGAAIAIAALAVTAALPVQAEVDDSAHQYAACINLTQRDPENAFESALAWHDEGGGTPADHCAAMALVALGEYGEAATRLEALADEMVRSNPDLVAQTLAQAANAWMLADASGRAEAVLTAALERAPEDPELLIDRARARAELGILDEAVSDLDLVLSLDPTRADALAFRAAARRHLGQTELALEDVETALVINPGSVDALLERGILRRMEGDRDGARHDWMTIIEIAANTPASDLARANIEQMDVRAD